MSLSSYIKSLRDKKGLTQEQAAKELGVTAQTIMNWENNRSTPDMHNIKNISQLYGIEMFDLLKKVADEVNETKNEQIEETVDICPWIHLLPSDFDYERLEKLRLTEQESNMLIDIKFASSFGGDLADIVNHDFPDKTEAINIINKLSFYGLCEWQDGKYNTRRELTLLGHNCYYMIYNNKSFLRDVYKLPFSSFIDVCDKLKLLKIKVKNTYNSYSIDLLSVLKLFNDGDVFLESYEKVENRWDSNQNKYGFKKASINSDILSLSEEFYTVEEVEWDNIEYQADREAYLKKLQFFEDNKEFIEDLREPSWVEPETLRKAIPTQKTIDFLAKLNE